MSSVQAQGVCAMIAGELCNLQTAVNPNDRAPVYMLSVEDHAVSIYRSNLTAQQVSELMRKGRCTETGQIWQLYYANGAKQLDLAVPADRRTLFSVLTAVRKAVMSWHQRAATDTSASSAIVNGSSH